MSFETAVKSVLKANGYKARSPNELIEWWKEFVKQCLDGYGSSIYEYDDEIGVRDYIESILTSEFIQTHKEFNNFYAQVRDIDQKFIDILLDDAKRPWRNNYWWRTGILKYAGEEYCSDIQSRYSIRVEEVE